MSTPAEKTKIFVQDVTLRDGMHAIRHRISPADVKRIVVALDEAGVEDCRWTPCFDCGVCDQMGTHIQVGPFERPSASATDLGLPSVRPQG